MGQGDGIFYRFESGTCIFIDGGSSDRKQLGENVIMPFLKYNGIQSISSCAAVFGFTSKIASRTAVHTTLWIQDFSFLCSYEWIFGGIFAKHAENIL